MLHCFFPPFRLDPVNAQLWRGDQEIRLRRKTFDVLLYLVHHPGQLVTKAALLDAIWPEVSVSDAVPATCVAELRKALGEEKRIPRFIETVHGRGYRFVAKVSTAATESSADERPFESKSPKPIMVGREAELAQLQSCYSHVLEGRRQVIFVAGESGIGKTTFVEVFLDPIAQERSARIGRGQCVEQYGAGEPYMPVLEALNRLVHKEPGGERLVDFLNRFAPTWLAQMPALLTREERIRLQSEIQSVTQQRMLREVIQALEALAAETPLVLLLEDLHWSDFSSLELISAIARRKESARLLIVGTYRPVEMLANNHPLGTMKQELELHRLCQELRLKLLTQENVAEYLGKRLAGYASRRFSKLAPVIHTRTEGNPLFMVNMLEYLVDRGLLVDSRELSEAEWAETLHAHRLDALRNIRQMIEWNLERLKPEERAVLEGASAAGVEFSSASVAAALDCPQNDVEGCCSRLSRREQFISEQAPITWPDGTVAASFRFHHALYQEVLYGRLSATDQFQLHRRIAIREETGYGERTGEVAAELADHYRRANDKEKAVRYFHLAGQRAVERAAMVEAERHFASALELVTELPEDVERDRRELELQLAVGPTLIAVKGWAASETERAYTRARRLCEQLGDPPELFPALFGMWAMYLDRGDFRTAYQFAEQLLQAQSAHDPALQTYARLALGATSHWMGKFLLAREHLESAITLYDPERHWPLIFRYGYDAGVASLSYAAWTLWYLGYSDQALKRSYEALALAQDLSHHFNLAHARLFVGVLHQYRGEGHAAQENAESLIAHSAEYGLRDYWAWATGLRGWGLAQQGLSVEGIAHLREGLAAFGATEALLRPYFLCLLADAWREAGRVDEGLDALTEALVAADEHEIRFYEAETHRLRGELLLKQDACKAAEAQSCFERAIEIARAQSAKSLELRACMRLARLVATHGRRDEARALLADIYNWFTEGFDTADLRDAKALLDELRA
ncbi:MAG: hypothetical protein C5B58_13940 [Acidobacteria bacterium]|nr:MAG: hypothetical protein C5B58_13940 [Acidobacteriota bacterium]